MLEFWEVLIEAVKLHPYLYIFVGMVFGGETVLVPAIYFAILGKLDLSYLVAISLAATLISDSFWYFLGRFLSHERAFSILGKRRAWAEKISTFFINRSSLIIIFSKFVYGTRTAVQIISGAHKIPFRKYLFADLGGILLLDAVLATLASLARISSFAVDDFVKQVSLALAIMVILVVGFHMLIKRFINRKLENNGFSNNSGL